MADLPSGGVSVRSLFWSSDASAAAMPVSICPPTQQGYHSFLRLEVDGE